MWWKLIVLVALGLAVVIVAASLYGFSRWKFGTEELRGRLEAARLPMSVRAYDPRELDSLPVPVQRYFRTALRDGQPMVAAVSVGHTGTFNMSETGEQWKPFTSVQRVITRRPGFDWDARIAIMPGLTVRVHDAYIAGEGILHASLLGLLSLVNLRGAPELTDGELMRFFAEAAWYPTALLASQGVQWQKVDDSSAKATLKDGETTVTMLFRFSESGLIESVRAEARGRTVGGTVIATPWEGRWSHYELRHGVRIPLEGEASWLLPEGPRPYWRGRIKSLTYEFVR
jgi:Family of unknown function (DUF6920)